MAEQELTLSQLLTRRCVEFSHSAKAVEIIDSGIEKMFKDVVDDAFRSYGDFGKQARDAFKNALPANIENIIELGRYNTLVVNALKEKWSNSGIADDLITKAEEALSEVMSESAVPSHISLRELLDSFIEEHQEEALENGWESPDFRFEEEGKYIHFYFDKRSKEESSSLSWRASSERSKYNLDNRIAARKADEEINGNPVYEIYSAALDGEEIRKITCLGTVRKKWERALVALYYGQAKLIFDCDPDDYAYPHSC